MPAPLVEAPASDAGSSDSILGSLWRSISGGPSTQPQPATRPEPAAGDGLSTEQLAIGFVEASGSLALAASYIRPDQMGLLLRHGGTGHGAEPGARSPPMGGGLSGWTPTSPRSSPASRTQRSIPLLVSSPAVLFSELVLGPGESQTFSIRMQLPKSLPPSFRGRVASIAYDLVVVAKRDMLDTSAHCVRIPFRVMAHVGSSDSAAVLSFAGPARMPPGHMQLTFQEAAPVSTPRNASPSPSSAASGGGCVADGAEPLAGPDDADDSSAATALLFEQLAGSYFLQQLLRSNGHGLEGLPAATKPACPRASVEDDVKRGVMSICRRRAPVAFSLSQGGRSVASVWLPKRAYQLGDLVIGKIHLQPEAASIYQVSVWLESVEVVQDRLASYSADRTEELTRKIHAEHHEFCRSTSMLGFALASLPTAAVSFASDIVSNVWQLRIELIAGLPGATASDLGLSATTPFPPEKRLPRSSLNADNGGAVTMRRRYDAAREVLVQTLSCTVGIHMYPSLASALPQGQRDSYTVDLTARGP
ncbi:Golgi membrane exchange factor (Ric1p-Rgp1p) subunit [Coemansia biformis]|uniref:Golgi membrane exchange factor (Ric1p-Rgp1p) subunit n=1 Tax=Coemansia biformis TaxID=1286918 RepID=A0A9W8CZA3_9FUNG|nr:Golgi membrane exchange factor (Ric1p-Rgp1p) subunit [Coemansia biformis]